TFDITAWWNEQSFPGKELYKLDETGNLVLCENNTVRERVIATITPENADIAVKNLIDKFQEVEAKVKEVELEWVTAEDKQVMTEKVTQLNEYLRHVNALGDFLKLSLLVHDW